MFCDNCGYQNRDGANYCFKCGKKLPEVEESVPQPAEEPTGNRPEPEHLSSKTNEFRADNSGYCLPPTSKVPSSAVSSVNSSSSAVSAMTGNSDPELGERPQPRQFREIKMKMPEPSTATAVAEEPLPINEGTKQQSKGSKVRSLFWFCLLLAVGVYWWLYFKPVLMEGKAPGDKIYKLRDALVRYRVDVGRFPFYGPAENKTNSAAYCSDLILSSTVTTSNVLMTRIDLEFDIPDYAKLWKGPYINGEPSDFMKDDWGNLIVYCYEYGNVYLWSYGPDGKPASDSPAKASVEYSDDIVLKLE